MPIVRSVGILTIPSAIDVPGFIGCGNNRTIAVRSIVPWVHFQEGHPIGGVSTSKHQLQIIPLVASTGSASSVMRIVCGARIPPANVSGARITRPCWIYQPSAKRDSRAPNATTMHWMGAITMIITVALVNAQLTSTSKCTEEGVLSWAYRIASMTLSLMEPLKLNTILGLATTTEDKQISACCAISGA